MSVRRLSVWVAAVLVGVAGCSGAEGSGGAGEPGGESSSVASGPATEETSPSGEPSDAVPQEPAPPPAMENFDEEGAKAFAEFYWEVATYAQTTGDTELLAEIQMPLCEACTGAREWVERVYSEDGRIIGSEMSGEVTSIQRVASTEADEVVSYVVETRLQSEQARVVNRKGKTTRRAKESESTISMVVDFLSDVGWRVGYWEEIE